MKPLIALVILGSIATSASAAGSDTRGLIDGQTGHTIISEQSTPISGYTGGYFGRGTAGFGRW